MNAEMALAKKKGLKRIAVYDSYVRGKKAVLDLDGHVHVFGINGAGKSSTIVLIPIFLGIRPERVVNKEKSSFLAYYLPSSRSYIAFEYLRDDGICTVVLFACKNRQQVHYRIIKGGFDDTILSDSFMDLSAELKNTGEALKKLSADDRYEMSVQIDNYLDYEAVICNLKRRLIKKKALQVEALRFSLCAQDAELNQMAELSYVSVGSEKLHVKLTKMVASIFGLDSLGVGAIANHSSCLPEMLDSIGTLNALREHKERFNKVILLSGVTESLYADLLAYRDHAALRHDQSINRVAALNDQAAAINIAFETQIKDLEAQKTAVYSQKLDCEVQLKSVSSQISDIELKEKYYSEANLEHKRHEYAGLQALANEVDVAAKHYSQLQSENADLEKDYLSQQNDSRVAVKESLDAVQDRKNSMAAQERDCHSKHQEAMGDIASGLRSALVEFDQKGYVEVDALEKDVLAASVKMGQNSVILPAEQAALDELYTRLEMTRLEVDTAQTSLDELKGVEERQKRDLRQKESDHAGILSRINFERGKLTDLEELQNPKGTVLAALRDNLSDDSLAEAITLIDKSLLLSKGVEVEKVDDSSSFFGLLLNVSGIAKPVEAESQAELNSRINDQIALIKQLEDQAHVVSSEIAELTDVIKKHRDKTSIAATELMKVKNHVDQTQALIREKRIAFDENIKHRKEIAAKRLKEVSAKLDVAKVEFKRKRSDIERQFELKKSSLIDGYNQQVEQFKINLKRLDAEIFAIKEDAVKREAELTQSYHDRLAERGVDKVVLEGAKDKLSKCQANHKRVQSYYAEIQQYMSWKENTLVLKPELLSARQKHRQTITDLSAIEAQHIANLKALRSEFTERLATNKAEALNVKQLRDSLLALVENIDKQVTDVLNVTASKLTVVEDDVFLSEAENAVRIYRTNLRKIDSELNFIIQILSSRTQSNQFSDWEKRRVQHVAHLGKSNYSLLMMREFSDMLTTSIPLAELNERTTFSAICQSVIRYFDTLKDFRRKIAAASKKLSHDIQVDNPLPTITNINLSIESMVRDDDPVYISMKHLKALYEFSPLVLSQEGDGEVSLPSQKLLDALSKAISGVGKLNYKGLDDLITLKIELYESGNYRLINNDSCYKDVASTGVSRLVVAMIFTSLAQYLNVDKDLMVHLPFDELGEIDTTNVIRLFGLLHSRNINMISAQPDVAPHIHECFSFRYQVDTKIGFRNYDNVKPLQIVNPILKALALDGAKSGVANV